MSNEESIRDKMEVHRTLQANERTLLDYLRTGLGLLVAGIVIVYVSHGDWFGAVGIACILVGGLVGMVGAARFRTMNKHISLIREQCAIDAKRKKD